MDDEWLELGEAARLLGRTERQVLRYAHSGRVATRRVGRRYQYRRDEVERLANELGDADATRQVSITPDVGRALVEVVSVQRELITSQRELLTAQQEIVTLRAEVERLRAELERQRVRYLGIIRKLMTRKRDDK